MRIISKKSVLVHNNQVTLLETPDLPATFLMEGIETNAFWLWAHSSKAQELAYYEYNGVIRGCVCFTQTLYPFFLSVVEMNKFLHWCQFVDEVRWKEEGF
jgi:hypothetical protein